MVSLGFLPWEIWVVVPGKSQMQQSHTTQPAVPAGCCSVSMGYGNFNVLTDVNTCDCARGSTDTVRESALHADSGRKIPCLTGDSNLRRLRAGPMPYQLSYVATRYSRITSDCMYGNRG